MLQDINRSVGESVSLRCEFDDYYDEVLNYLSPFFPAFGSQVILWLIRRLRWETEGLYIIT